MLAINEIYHGDCFDFFPQIDDKSIDMIFCDLPYGTTACHWDVILPFEPLWAAYKRIIKDNGAIVLTGSQPFTSMLVMSNLEMFRYEWIWEKSKASNFLQASYMPLKSHENIIIFSKKTTTYNPQKTNGLPYKRGIRKHKDGIVSENYNKVPNAGIGSTNDTGLRNPRSCFYIKTAECEGKQEHPTQKPVALLEYLLKTYTNEGELVLDNCIGSGTTAVACVNTNRRYIGIEKEAKYYEIAKRRVAEAKVNLGLFRREE